MQSNDRIPVAMLVLYEPGFRFKFKKYFLQKGNNLVGSGTIADVRLEDGPQKAAMISITDQLALIQPLLENSVFIMSNMKKKTPTKLKMGMSYVVEMQKDFSIGERKALMQVMDAEDLWRVNNVQNRHFFQKKVPTSKIQSQQKKQPQFQPTIIMNDNELFQPTIPLDANGSFQPTVPINDDGYFDPTLPINQHEYFEPTLPIEQQFQKNQPQMNPEPNQRQQNFSMPDTISQHDANDAMPDTIQDNMPDTIKQDIVDEGPPSKMTKTVPLKKNQGIGQKAFQSLSDPPIKPAQNFDQLFLSGTYSDPQVKNSQIKKAEVESQKKKEMSVIQHQESDGTEKMQSQNEDKGFKRVGVLNCKKKDINEKQLKKKGYKLVDHPDHEYDILLVGTGELKRSPKLMMALMDGKEIKSIQWITNPKAKITGKLQGFLWESIDKRKGNKGKIFAGNYYLQPALRDQFEEVMRYGGATMIEVIGKNRAKSSISIIIDEKHPEGRQLFEEKKNYKKWQFYSYKMVIESVLMGEQIKTKYILDEYSF